MSKQYNNISVFKAKPSQNEKAPQFNVVIEMADGQKFRGGLWERTSKAGTKYLSGSLEEDNGGAIAPKSSPAKNDFAVADDVIDW
jgi:uncharacterized protein (DUF736 family)